MHALDHMRDAERMAAESMAARDGHKPAARCVLGMRRYAADSELDRARTMARRHSQAKEHIR